MSTHETYMKLALDNAKITKGQTDPNPLVGSVIVNKGRVVGIGAHLKPGEPHAEIHALRMAGDYAEGATIYVTLEPCSHHGRTGPCAEAIIQAGIRRVVIAALDPNPLVSGRGVAMLEAAGIEVIVGVCEEESLRMNEVFNTFIVSKRPFVTIKAATTLDGKIATHTSESKWITSEAARVDVHRLRNENLAILVGVQTVIHDNPKLTTRLPEGRNPLRVVLDSSLRIPMDAYVITDQEADTWIFTGGNYDRAKKNELEQLGVKVFQAGEGRRTDLEQVLTILGEHEVSSLLVEGGGEVNASFIQQGLVDKLILYMAPKLIGGKTAPTFLEGSGIAAMYEAIQLMDMTVEQIGVDLKIQGYIRKST